MTDLFKTAGVELPTIAAVRPTARKPRRLPLIAAKVLQKAIGLTVFNPSAEQLKTAENYAKNARSDGFLKQKETSIRDLFYDQVLQRLLGYKRYDSDSSYSLIPERGTKTGPADVVIGTFSETEGDVILAPCEMKGPSYTNLDAIDAKTGRSPVQQAWGYANAIPGAQWVLVSNCIELRLYRFGRGIEAYELFDLRQLNDPDEYRRLVLLLGEANFIGGKTEELLIASDTALSNVTNELYAQYRALRDKLLAFVINAVDGPKLSRRAAIEPVQKLLDRVLFVAFGGGTGLLPPRLLQLSATPAVAIKPPPLWKNFRDLFEAVDIGSGPPMHIWAYNGGLFAPDAVLDRIEFPDHLATEIAELGKWDFGSEVPVTVLGRIFEQSITDLEKLRAEANNEAPPAVGKVKREGVVYTPDHIARFLVEHTIGKTLEENFSGLLLKYVGKSVLPNTDEAPLWPSEDVERAFWQDYLAALRSLTILDPACGSGAFLAAAFDVLAAEYTRVLDRLAVLGMDTGLDAFDEILSQNLFGVDLNIESVEISRLSLWLKTARQKHRLASLNETVRDGNSLIADKKFAERPFTWDGRFAEIAKRGGFDIVIGNPPYVRMEFLKEVKPYFSEHYVVADERTDLYAYFFEKAVSLLKPGGRFGYISSSTFFRTGSGEKLRVLMAERTAIETVVDFGDTQVFEGVTTYPAIITARRLLNDEKPDGELKFLKIADRVPHDLGSMFAASSQSMARAQLKGASWQFENDVLSKLREKIVAGRKTLGEVYGPPMRGIITGLNEAFIVDTPTRDKLVARDAKSAELLKPFLKGESIKRWRVEPEGLFLINIPKGKIKIDDYPAIRDHLLPFKEALEKRATQQEWFELQQAQVAYQEAFNASKIAYQDICNSNTFCLDKSGALLSRVLKDSQRIGKMIHSRSLIRELDDVWQISIGSDCGAAGSP